MNIEIEENSTEMVLNFYVECDDCGRELRIRKEENSDGVIILKVDKCSKCCMESFDDGYVQGEFDGKKDNE